MGLFDRVKEPIFLKESSNAHLQLERLKELEQYLNEDGKNVLRQDIKYIEYGIVGEKNIAFELKNSHMPMYILHDIYLEDGELSAQIDYLVITKKMCFVIECKNLYGDIEINSNGDFIRYIDFAGKKKKEGIYSPLTQNQRHLELIKKIRAEHQSNIISKYMFEKHFDSLYQSVVVLANPKTILNAKYAKKDVKDKVIRSDQLVKYIKSVYDKSTEATSSDKGMLEWAESFLKLHKEEDKDYTLKYEKYRVKANLVELSEEIALTEELYKGESIKYVEAIEHQDTNESNKQDELVINQQLEVLGESFKLQTIADKYPVKIEIPIEEIELFQKLKAYRLHRSREEKIKPYFIYNDNQLKDLIEKMPRSRAELLAVAGFGEAKANKYGNDILEIINNSI